MLRQLVCAAFAATLLTAPLTAQEPTLEQVLEKHYQALGGLDQWLATSTAKFTGTFSLGPSMEAGFTMVVSRPRKMRLEFTVQGMTGIQAYDGQTAWMLMPFMGKTAPEPMPEDQAKEIREQGDLDGPLMGWKEDGNQLELVGKEDVEGTPAYKLKVTLPSGDVQYHYLEAEHFLTIKSEGKRMLQGREVEFETILGDYKQVGALLFPHFIENRLKGSPMQQVLTITAVELNVPVDDALFKMPSN
ncbi:MAG: hypothetical protein HY561_11330 [Gemmatimonadetes bacterium]|nr:hypothetical protein [Gemmatimonadota bacterium]